VNEKEYTNELIIPLLKYMGFMEVTYNHGITEFGKDVVFSEYDKFGNKKYHAAQIKVGNISGGNKGQIQDLISHILNAFNLEFNDLISKQTVSINNYYLITSGQFIGTAKEILLNDRRLELYKHRIHFYEGQHIDELFERNFKEIKELLMSEVNETLLNIEISDLIRTELLENKMETASVQYTFIHNNLDELVRKLSMYREKESLRKKLERYQLG
jgi:hypothetical protein